MAKGVTVQYGQFVKQATKEMEAFQSAILRRLQYIGEKAVSFARTSHPNDWKDQTGNLRSSIGYVVLDDGKVVAQGNPSGTGEGVQEGERLLSRLASQYPQGLVLIVCAGMQYASYVESRGRDVLTGAELLAERLVNELVQQLSK